MFALRLRDLFLVALAVLLRSQTSAVGHDGPLMRRQWNPNQVNTTMCTWEQPRSAVIRDTFYIDGGYISFLPGFANGSVGAVDQPEDGSILYAINFTHPFNTSQNASSIMQSIQNPAGSSGNLALDYYDGTLFANNDEFYAYGGLLRDTDSDTAPSATDVQGYERYQYGPYRQSWSVGYNEGTLPTGVTRYVTAGAGVNAPSENLGFYFSGLRGQAWGEIRVQGRQQYNATIIANTLISVDMSTMRKEKYTNDTIDSSIDGRANAELAWIPTSDRGLLVAVGGVVNPEWAYAEISDKQKVQSQNTSPGFMKTVPVYDIANQKWYSQATSGDTPGQLTQFCSVVASAEDGSSHNIYIYGGWNGIDDTDAPSDDVYILSIPSFTWIKAVNGTSTHGRRSHKCAQIYPDQMIVVGGQTQQLDTTVCLDQGLIQVFNLNTLQWQDKYDPTVWSDYKVPDIVTAKIGGSSDGGATTLKPSKWSDNDLSDLFGSKYTKTIPTYYPYSSVQPTGAGTPNPTRASTNVPSPVPKSGGVPSYVAPVVGVVLGLVVLTAVLTCILLYRRRKYFQRWGGSSADGTSTFQQARVWDWIAGNRPPQVVVNEVKDDTVTSTTEEPSSVSAPSGVNANPYGSQIDEATGRPISPELGTESQIHELPGTPTTYELATKQAGLTPAATTGPSRSHASRPSLPSSRRQSPRPPLSTSSSAGTNVSAGSAVEGDIQRPDSPTTSTNSIRPAHQRAVSSIDSTSSSLNVVSNGHGNNENSATQSNNPAASDWEHRGAVTPPSAEMQGPDPLDRMGLFSPVSPEAERQTQPPQQQQQQHRRVASSTSSRGERQSNFEEHVE